MATLRNVYACLVHEQFDCVVDLIRNLRYFDPVSPILLYNGSSDPAFLRRPFPFERHGVIVHPSPQPAQWGRLHGFALDCMLFALENCPFDTLTVVDSDQLATRSGYSDRLATLLADRPRAGLLGNNPVVQPANTRAPAPATAFREIESWRPFLRRFPHGEQQFVRWCFWPATVFTSDAARELTRLCTHDAQLRDLITKTQIWATEEVILPTLVALAGFDVLHGPCRYDFVQYRKSYSAVQVAAAMGDPDVFWIHPVTRRYQDGLRTALRARHEHYRLGAAMSAPTTSPAESLPRTLALPAAMRTAEGWLEEDEASLLLATAAKSLESPGRAIVEIGSYCGRATIVLGHAVKEMRAPTKVSAVDLLDGCVGALDQGLHYLPPTHGRFRQNIAKAGLDDMVEWIQKRATETAWERPIGLLVIDGLHDYVNVAEDFYHFQPWIASGGYVAFHDYAEYYPGVRAFVDELLTGDEFEFVELVRSLIVVRRRASARVPCHVASPAALSRELVSCIMATADRAEFVPQAVSYFLRQDYPHRELIIVDDGADSVAPLVPRDSRIRYVRLEHRRTMGAKHNLACELASGDIICHWDDDDWNAERRISYQVEELSSCPVMTLSGLSRLLYYEPATGKAAEYVYPANERPWVCGNTFCYRKQFWHHHRFPDLNEGADTRFVWSLVDAKVHAHPDPTFFVAIIHASNTSPKRTRTAGWHAHSAQHIRGLLKDDCAFYDRWRV